MLSTPQGQPPVHRIVTTAREFQKANQLQLRTIPTVSFLTGPTSPSLVGAFL
jgi:hypothetical protein